MRFSFADRASQSLVDLIHAAKPEPSVELPQASIFPPCCTGPVVSDERIPVKRPMIVSGTLSRSPPNQLARLRCSPPRLLISQRFADMIAWSLSDYTIPRSYRMMKGFGVNTFVLVNAEGKRTCTSSSCFPFDLELITFPR